VIPSFFFNTTNGYSKRNTTRWYILVSGLRGTKYDDPVKLWEHAFDIDILTGVMTIHED
jgi:hypothetical protein